MELVLIGVILSVMSFLASLFGSYFGSRWAWYHLLIPPQEGRNPNEI
jgi:hypothetical protein